MFAYQGNPRVELLLPEGNRWLLLEDWWFTWVGEDGRKITRTVKAGTVTDFGSIPRIWWWRFSPTGRFAPAYLAHDALYAEGAEPRDVCDRVLHMGIEACGGGWWDRNVIHKAVRLGGWRAYGKRRDERAKA